jgi:hypothetical protein
VTALIKYETPVDPREDYIRAYIRGMYALYLRCPGRDTRDENGVVDLGELGESRSDRGIDRATPYSPGRVRA